ncbi:MAG: hypothetical protein BZ151_00290 [Desulfobacca sp. 4484_104]|nr:MAG: hypothetical protein BZ151_00290 [Desulfobacca sp. 4484_104]
MIKREVWYFDKTGPENTDACLEILARAQVEGFKYFVVASTTGDTGVKAARLLAGKNINLVIVGHSVGFKGPNIDEFKEDNYRRIWTLGVPVYKGTILTHSLETSLAEQFKGSAPTLLIANTLRRLGQGMKVCCEIVMEAVDAGLIPEGVEVVAMAGTAWGADTVAVLRSAASKRFLDLTVLEIWAKPRG